MEYYSATNKNEIMKVVGKCVNLERVIPNEVTQAGKQERHILSLTLVIASKSFVTLEEKSFY